MTLYAVYWPEVVLNLILVLAHSGVVVVVVVAGLRLGGGQGGLGDHGGLGEVVQGELCMVVLLLLGRESRGEYSGHLRLLLLNESAEREREAEVREGGRVVEGGVEGLELHCVCGLVRGLLRDVLLAARSEMMLAGGVTPHAQLTRC